MTGGLEISQNETEMAQVKIITGEREHLTQSFISVAAEERPHLRGSERQRHAVLQGRCLPPVEVPVRP